MTTFGYTLSSEEHAPSDLVRNAVRAEEVGFDYLSISDHYHPWVGAQGHAGFVWSVLGAVAASTDRVRVGVGVTCPIVRIHPAVLAQATATTSLLLGGRFFWGVGTGEALNEHVLGDRWPPAPVRLAMLEEAVAIVRELWTGDSVSHRGEHYEVENARLYDPPADEIPVVVSAFGPKASALAADIGDGYWGTSPDADIVARYTDAGGTGPRYGQVDVCWGDDPAAARRTVHEVWPNGGVPGQLKQELAAVSLFETAAELVTEDDAVGDTPCGADVDAVVARVRQYEEAGYDHVHLHQIGPDQEGFLSAWERELGPALGGS